MQQPQAAPLHAGVRAVRWQCEHDIRHLHPPAGTARRSTPEPATSTPAWRRCAAAPCRSCRLGCRCCYCRCCWQCCRCRRRRARAARRAWHRLPEGSLAAADGSTAPPGPRRHARPCTRCRAKEGGRGRLAGGLQKRKMDILKEVGGLKATLQEQTGGGSGVPAAAAAAPASGRAARDAGRLVRAAVISGVRY